MEVEYAVNREIEPVEFSVSYVKRRRETIRKNFIDEGVYDPSDEKVEQRLREQLRETAKNMTLEDQGHNDLHRDIKYGEVVKK